jgi:hypothetical protein
VVSTALGQRVGFRGPFLMWSACLWSFALSKIKAISVASKI